MIINRQMLKIFIDFHLNIIYLSENIILVLSIDISYIIIINTNIRYLILNIFLL